MIGVGTMLASVGIDFVKDLIKDNGEDLVKEGIKKVTGIDLSKKEVKELTNEEIVALKEAEYRLKSLDFEKLKLELEDKKEDNRHEEKYEKLKVNDKQNARSSVHLGELQTSVAQKIYDQTKVVIPVLLVLDVAIVLVSDKYGINTAAVVGVSNLVGIALNNAYRERQSIIEFLFGSSVGSKQKEEKLL